jgi:hypothetical protein
MWCLPVKKHCCGKCKDTGYVDPGVPADIPYGDEFDPVETTCSKCEDHFTEELDNLRAVVDNLKARNNDLQRGIELADQRIAIELANQRIASLETPKVDLVSGESESDLIIPAEHCTDDEPLTEAKVVAEIPPRTPPNMMKVPLELRVQAQEEKLERAMIYIDRLEARVTEGEGHLRTAIEELNNRVNRQGDVLKDISKEWHSRARDLTRSVRILREEGLNENPGCGRDPV